MTSPEKRSPASGPYRPTVILHGGAGALSRDNLPPALWEQYKASLLKYLKSTRDLLDSGASALDAATHAVTLFEDDPLFNCGRGAVFTESGSIELEASLMVTSIDPKGPPQGFVKRAAAVSLVKNTRHPILLAKQVLIASDDEEGLGGTASMHTHLSGRQLEEWGWDQKGLERKPDHWFWTKKRWEEHRRGLSKSQSPDLYTFEDLLASVNAPQQHQCQHEYQDIDLDVIGIPSQGTVGAVALDSWGNLATATSTGGLTNKKAGRIGDTPTVGAGFWAESWDQHAVSAFAPASPASQTSVLEQISETVLKNARAATECFEIWQNPSTGPRQPAESPPPYAVVTQEPGISPKHMSFAGQAGLSQRRRAVALSGTGNGDSFLRTNAVRTAASISRFSPNNCSLSHAVTSIAGPGGELQRSAGKRWGQTGEGQGGIIGIEIDQELGTHGTGKIGRIVFDFNCGGLFRAYYQDNERGQEVPRVGVFRDEC